MFNLWWTDWIEQGLTSHSTHWGHFGDRGVTAASARIYIAAVNLWWK